MEQHDTRVTYPSVPGDRWTRDRFDLDTVTVRRRPRFARLLDQPNEVGSALYRHLVSLRSAAWATQDATRYEPVPGGPSTREARYWYAQGRVEAYADAMTEIERTAKL